MAAKRAKQKTSKDRLNLSLVIALVVVLVAVLGYRIYSRFSPPPQTARKPRLEKVVAGEERLLTAGDIRVQRRVEGNAVDWREKVLDTPEEARISKSGKVLVPTIKVYEDKDVYLPLRIMVGESEEEEGHVPFWKKKEKPKGPTPLTD